LDVSLVKLNLMYIASNSEGSKDALLLAKYSSPVSIQLHHLLSTRLPTVDLSIPADVTEYCSDLVAQEPASLLEGPDAANDLVDFVEEIEEALLDFLLPDFSEFTAEAEPAQEPGPGPAQGGEAATTEGEPTDLSVDVQELEKGSSTKTVRHVPPTVLFVPPTGALEAMKAHRGAIVLDLDAMYDENDDAVDIVAKFRAFEQAQAIILSQPAASTTTTASAASGEGSFLSSSASPTPRRSWAATRSRSEIKRSRRGPSRACIVVGITANEEAQEQARAVGGFDVLALKPLSTDQALALLLRFFPQPPASSSSPAPPTPLDGSSS
jgi:CheY-like chemotaxis protein